MERIVFLLLNSDEAFDKIIMGLYKTRFDRITLCLYGVKSDCIQEVFKSLEE